MPQLFGVIHSVEEKDALEKVIPHLKTGSTLWVEHFTLYPLVVREAKRRGVKVLSLDEPLDRKLLKNAPFGDIQRFITYHFREQRWIEKLTHNAGERDLVVAFPSHVRALVKEMTDPSVKIRFMQTIPNFYKQRSFPRLSTRQATVVRQYVEGLLELPLEERRRRALEGPRTVKEIAEHLKK